MKTDQQHWVRAGKCELSLWQISEAGRGLDRESTVNPIQIRAPFIFKKSLNLKVSWHMSNSRILNCVRKEKDNTNINGLTLSSCHSLKSISLYLGNLPTISDYESYKHVNNGSRVLLSTLLLGWFSHKIFCMNQKCTGIIISNMKSFFFFLP